MKQKFHRVFAAMATATLTTSALLSSVSAVAAQEQAAATLNVGDAVPALDGITWLQGDPVKSLDEKGKVYMLELWATWCGPCVAIIPHVNDLHKKYADKGLVIVGMNVWEDKVETPTVFLKQQGDGMSYRVAFSGGKEGAFTKDWLTPAGIQGIPHALIVKDGKLIFKGHPASLEDSTIEAMLDGSYDAAAESKKAEAAVKAEEELRSKIMPLMQSGDWDGVLKLAETLEDSNPAKMQLKLTAITQKADWNALAAFRTELAKKESSPLSVEQLDNNAGLSMKAADGAKEYATVALAALNPTAKDAAAPDKLRDALVKARLNFLVGNTEAATATLVAAKPLIETVEAAQMKQQLSIIFPAAEKAIADGKFPPIGELLRPQQ